EQRSSCAEAILCGQAHAGQHPDKRMPAAWWTPPACHENELFRAGRERQLGDDSRSAAEGEIRPHPLEEHAHAVLEADKEEEVDEGPSHPGHDAAELERAHLADTGM